MFACPGCRASALVAIVRDGRPPPCPKCRGATPHERRARTGRFRPSLEELEPVLVPSAPLHVVGTQLETPTGQAVQLRGVNVDGQEGWSNPAGGLVYDTDVKDAVERAVTAALDVWHATLIRLPINQDFWLGLDPGVNATAYVSDIDHLIQQAAGAGAYVMLDVQVSDGGTGNPLRESGSYSLPDNNTAAFWTSAARHYASDPAVLFDLFNEPGHFVANYTQYKSGAAHFTETVDGTSVTYASPGMQGLIDDIRSVAGSNNVIAAEGMGYADDFSAVAAAVAAGNGLTDSAHELMYSAHIYPGSVPDSSDVAALDGLLPAAVTARYPIYVGEWGADVNPGAEGAPATAAAVWNQNLLNWLAAEPYSWTAWAMNAGPWLTAPGTTTPTTYFGRLVLNDLTSTSVPTGAPATVQFVNTNSGAVTGVSGNPITYTVQVTGGSGTPTGTVRFSDATTGADLGVANLDGNGFAQLTVPAADRGKSEIRAVYSGDGSYRTGSATAAQVVTDISLYAAGSATGGPGIVTAFSPMTGAARVQFAPFGAYAGGVKVAVGDVNGDGYDDLIVMAGPGSLNGLVEIYSGKDFSLLSEYFAFPGYQGEFNIAAGDLTGNGIADVIFSTATGADFVFAYAGTSTQMMTIFSAFGGFTGGVTVAVGDVRGAGYDQIIVGTATRVGAAGVFNTSGQLLQPYYFAPIPMNGVNVAAGDLTGSGRDDVIFGARDSTLVLVYDGASQALTDFFFAYPGQSFGVTVATVDRDGDGKADIITGFTGDTNVFGIYSGVTFQLIDIGLTPGGTHGLHVAGSGTV